MWSEGPGHPCDDRCPYVPCPVPCFLGINLVTFFDCVKSCRSQECMPMASMLGLVPFRALFLLMPLWEAVKVLIMLCVQVAKKMKAQGIRVTVDAPPASLSKKIRNAELQKVCFFISSEITPKSTRNCEPRCRGKPATANLRWERFAHYS